MRLNTPGSHSLYVSRSIYHLRCLSVLTPLFQPKMKAITKEAKRPTIANGTWPPDPRVILGPLYEERLAQSGGVAAMFWKHLSEPPSLTIDRFRGIVWRSSC